MLHFYISRNFINLKEHFITNVFHWFIWTTQLMLSSGYLHKNNWTIKLKKTMKNRKMAFDVGPI